MFDAAHLRTVLHNPNRQGQRCIAMISTHGYVSSVPNLGMADTGGQVVYVLELAKSLAGMGYHVDIWTRHFEDQPSIDRLDDCQERVHILRLPCGGSDFIAKEYLYRHLDPWIDLASRMISESATRYDFINSHYWDAGIVGSALAKVLRTPHVFTPHSLGQWKLSQMQADYPGDKAAFESQYNFRERIPAEEQVIATADLVVATSPMQQEIINSQYRIRADRLRMIPPGYDDRRFFPVSESTRTGIRQRLGFTGPTVLALGRLARNKGYDLLIRGFAHVASRVPKAQLRLAIGGETLGELETKLLEELRTLIQDLRLGAHVVVDHFIPDDQLADWYRAADAFVLSSRYEPFGMTAVEAMASGTPTVITTHGGLWQQLKYGLHALFADPFDQADLGSTIVKMLKIDQITSALRNGAPGRMRGAFTWTGIATTLIAATESSILQSNA